MKRPGHHLHHDRLVECYLARRLGELTDPPVAEHLAECVTCRGRFDELSRALDGARADADHEFHAIFSADRLRAHQSTIARRLEQVGRSARVLPFRASEPDRRRLAKRPRIVPRWVAAVVAAGLVVGVGVNVFLGAGARRSRVPSSAVEPSHAGTGAAQPSVPIGEIDDTFLSELEHAAYGPRPPELEALDALTPHILEISAPTELC